jgi:tetratricopeptide (TPR) repeat protein
MHRGLTIPRTVGVVVLVASSVLFGLAQGSQNPPASIRQIEDQIRQHPANPKLYVALGLAYWQRDDFLHALESFQRAVKVGPGSAEAHNWLGVAILEKGDFTGSIAEFRKTIALDPKYTRAYANLGSALTKNGELAEAVKVFQTAVALEPNSPVAHMNLGVALRAKGDAKGALSHLRFVVQHEPDDTNARLMLGQTLQQSGDLSGAIQAFENTVRIDPEFREGYYALGSALKQQAASMPKPRPVSPSPADELYKRGEEAAAQGDLKEAQRWLEEAVNKDASSADAQNLLGYILGQQGDLISALGHLEKAVALRPDVSDTLYNFGVALWYSGSKPKAIAELREAVRLDPSAGPSCAFLGTALRESRQLEDARRYLQHAIALQPSFAAYYVDLGLVFLGTGDLDRAIGQFETGLNFSVASAGPLPDWDAAVGGLRQALSTKADRADAHNLLGLLLGHKGADSKEVLAEFREAVRLRPNFAEAHNNIGLVLAQADDGQGAITEFREALRIQPDYVDALTNLGAALISTSGDSAEAIRVLEKAVALAPTSLKAQFNLAEAYGADPTYGRLKEIEQLRKVIATDATFPGAHLALGKALLGEGNVEKSVGVLEEAARLDPQGTRAHYQLGLALTRAGRKEEAAKELQKSRELASADDHRQNSDLDIAEGRVALDKGDLDEAATKFKHALTLEPKSSDGEHLLGVVLEKQGDTEGAVAAYRKTLELNPGDVSARERVEALSAEKSGIDDPARMAEFTNYIQTGRFQEVEPLLAAYVKDHPKSSWGWYALGYSRFAQKKIGESIQALAQSLQLDIQNAEAHKILGRDLMIIGRLDAAQAEFEQGIRYKPQSAEMYFNLGKLFSIRDNWAPARQEFEAALRIDPNYVEGLDGLGFAQDALNDDDAAVASYEKAIAINASRQGTFVSSHVNLSAHYNRKGDSEKALEYARTALKLDPKSDGAWFQQAKALEAQGQLNDAVDSLNKAVAINPRSASYYYVLANICKRLGRTEERRQALESFQHLEKESNEMEEMRGSLANRSPAPPKPSSQHD